MRSRRSALLPPGREGAVWGKIDYEARAKGGLQEGDDGASMALGRYVLR